VTINQELFDGQNLPVSYDLVCRLDGKVPVFVFSASKAAISQSSTLVHLIDDFRETFEGIGEFQNSEEGLGFGGCFRPSLPSLPLEGFSTWEASLPARIIGKKGTNWIEAYRLSCSLALLTGGFLFVETKPNKMGLQQLAVPVLVCRMGVFALEITLSPTVRQWIAARRQETEGMAIKMMVACFDRMWPDFLSQDRSFRLHSFRVFDNGRGTGLVMDVPGNATGIYVDGFGLNDGPGWELDSHNVDNPVQQLSLLAGLTSVLRLVRESQLK